MRIANHMIVAGSEKPEDLARCLESVEGKVDKSFVLVTSETRGDGLKKVCEKYGAEYKYEPGKFFHKVTKKDVKFIKDMGLTPFVKEGDKLFEFDRARNAALEMIPDDYRWTIWLDTDDILRGDIRKIVEDAERNNLDSAFLNYIYQADIEDGKIKNILIEHLRERIIKNTGIYKWEAPIHETLIEQRPTRKKDYKEADVLHLSGQERRLKAIKRNVKTLELSIIRKKGKDPRPIYYLGKAYFDLWLTEQEQVFLAPAKKLFETYLGGENPSGWAEERSQCWEYLVEIYRSMGKVDEAIKCAHNAMIEDEKFPSIYVNLALCYVYKKEWGRALWWVKRVAHMPEPTSTLVVSPRDMMARTMEVIYHASINLNKLDEAYAAAVKLKEIYPNRKDIQERYVFTAQLRENREITKLVHQLASYLEQTNQQDKLLPLTQAIPNNIRENPFMVELFKKVNPPRVHGEDEITIYCGPAFRPWGPKNVEDGESFIGGSEEAVIYLSKELAKQGWRVTVYADPMEQEGEYDGVRYLPYYKFNTMDNFNVLVSWRRPDLVDQNLKARKTYIWCHDIQNQLDYTPERLSKITKIIVLSPWHRTNLPDIPDEKIMISGNGINL